MKRTSLHGNLPWTSIHHLSGPKHVCSRSQHSQDHGRRLNPIYQPNTEHHDKNARVRANGDKRARWMELHLGLQCSRLKICFCRQDRGGGREAWPGASSQHRHDAGAPSVLHRVWKQLVLRVSVGACRTRSAETFCVFVLGSHRGARHDCLRNSCARDVGILSIVIVVFIMEKEIRFFCCLFLFHLRLIEECDVEVLVAPSFRCDARAFPPLRRHAEPMRRFVVLRRGLLQRLLDRDVLWEIFSCSGVSCTTRCMAPSSHGGACRGHDSRDRADEALPVHLASNGGSIVCHLSDDVADASNQPHS